MRPPEPPQANVQPLENTNAHGVEAFEKHEILLFLSLGDFYSQVARIARENLTRFEPNRTALSRAVWCFKRSNVKTHPFRRETAYTHNASSLVARCERYAHLLPAFMRHWPQRAAALASFWFPRCERYMRASCLLSLATAHKGQQQIAHDNVFWTKILVALDNVSGPRNS